MSEADQKAPSFLNRMNHASGGWFGMLRQIYFRFGEMRGVEAAASMAYYALFSIFPLTLLVASLLGFFFETESAFMQAIAFVRNIFPFSDAILSADLKDVFTQRGALGIVGLIGLLWSASGFFNVLARNVNLAWPKVKLRSFVQSRLLALGMVGVLFALTLISLISSTLLSLLRAFGPDLSPALAPGWVLFLRLFSMAFTFLLFVAMYRWVPNKHVHWKAVLEGSLIVAVCWEGAKEAFSLYLSSGLMRYESVYGSLSTLVALMFWIYLSNVIALFGAHIVAALDTVIDHKVAKEKEQVVLQPEPVFVEAEKESSPRGIRG